MLRNTYISINNTLKKLYYSPYPTKSKVADSVNIRNYTTSSTLSSTQSNNNNNDLNININSFNNDKNNLNNNSNNNNNNSKVNNQKKQESSETPSTINIFNDDNPNKRYKYTPITSKILNEGHNYDLIRSLVVKKPEDTVRAKNRYLIVGLGNPGKEYQFTRHNIGFMAIDKLAQLLGTDINDNLKHSHITTTWLELDEKIKTKKEKKNKNKNNNNNSNNKLETVKTEKEDKEGEGEEEENDNQDVNSSNNNNNNENNEKQQQQVEVIERQERKKVTIEVILAKPMKYMNLSGTSVRSLLNTYNVPISNILIMVDDMAVDLGKLRLRSKGGSGGQNGLEDIIKRLGTEKVNRLRLGIGIPKPGEDKAVYVLKKFPMESLQNISEITDRASRIALMWLECDILYAMNHANKY